MPEATGLPPLPRSFRGLRVVGREAARRASRVSGPFRSDASAYLAPDDPESLRELVGWAHEHRVALVPRGAGTGMPGGNLGPSVVVSLAERFQRIEADHEAGTLRAGAGAVAHRIDQVARTEMGMHLPFLPASARWCTIGGMVANNAAGPGSFRHGATARWIAGLRGIDATGTPFHLRRTSREAVGRSRHVGHPFADLRIDVPLTGEGHPRGWPDVRKNSSGYALDRYLPEGDPLELLVGSEGTLALFTEVEVRAVPVPPARGVLVLPARALDDAVALAAGAAEIGADSCEFLGRRFLEVAGLLDDPLTSALARDAFALFVLDFSGSPDRVSQGLDRGQELGRQVAGAGRRAHSADEADRLWRLRKAASPVIARQADRGLVSTQFIEDSVVPVRHLGVYLQELDRILRGGGFDAVIFGHAGDGHLHVNPLVDVRSTDWKPRVRWVLDEVVELVAGLGGTLAGEHGDGRLRAPFLERIWGTPLASAFSDLKNQLDPMGILNPGVIVPRAGQDPLEDFVPRPRTYP